MARITGMELGRILAEALGISPKNVQRIVIIADVRDAAKMEITLLLEDDQAEKLAEVLRRYSLVEEAEEAVKP